MPERIASVRHTSIVIGIFLVLAAAGFVGSRSSTVPSAPPRLQLYVSVVLPQLVLLWFVAAGVRKHGGSIARLTGVVATPRQWLVDLAVALGGGVLLRVLTEAARLLVGTYSDHTAALLPVTQTEKTTWVVVAITAGICEEIVFRGYLFRQFEAFTGNRWAALSLQALLFGVSHGYQGWKSVVVITVYGAGIGLVALVRGNVRAPVIIHAATDLVGGLLRV